MAAILLGIGGVLLRHDNKIREHIQAFQTEVLYFSRLKTGLDCARALGLDEHRAGLKTVVGHLLAKAPTLSSAAEDTPEPEEEAPGAKVAESISGALEKLSKK